MLFKAERFHSQKGMICGSTAHDQCNIHALTDKLKFLMEYRSFHSDKIHYGRYIDIIYRVELHGLNLERLRVFFQQKCLFMWMKADL